MRYKEVIGGTIKQAEEKFPWLKEAYFENAVVNISGSFLIWESGTWENGIWGNGIWGNGIWESGRWKNGTWESGRWQNGTWESGVWKSGVWKSGVWQNGTWEYGTWENGIWEREFSVETRNKWKVTRNKNRIKIGCKEKTIKEWDEWFKSDEEFETPRGTQDFELIRKAYLVTRYGAYLDGDVNETIH